MTEPEYMNAAFEARIAELEIKLGDADDSLAALNLTVFRQQRQIEQLQMEIHALRQQFLAAPTGEAHSLRDEIPPHY
jgi:SlyX protein